MRKNIFLKVRLRSLEKKLFWSTLTDLVHCKVNNRKVANESLMGWKKREYLSMTGVLEKSNKLSRGPIHHQLWFTYYTATKTWNVSKEKLNLWPNAEGTGNLVPLVIQKWLFQRRKLYIKFNKFVGTTTSCFINDTSWTLCFELNSVNSTSRWLELKVVSSKPNFWVRKLTYMNLQTVKLHIVSLI